MSLRWVAWRRSLRLKGVIVVLAVCVVASGGSGCVARAGSTATTAAVSDAVLRVRVEDALASASDVNAGRLTIETSRGAVTLSGQVASGLEQQSVGAIVRAVPGVEEVFFSLSIEPAPDPGDGA